MTTEIAVLNRLGIALATDSAVTIGGGSNEKVFDTADKLFELSPIYPVALMVNGNMDFLGVPWEIIVKDFREKCGLHQRPNIRQWIDDFIIFVGSYSEVSQKQSDSIIEYKVASICGAIKESVAEGFFESVRVPGPIRKSADFERWLSSYLLRIVNEFQIMFDKFGIADSLASLSREDIVQRYICLSSEYIREQFIPHPLTEGEIEALKNLLATVLLAADSTNYTTGIVVSGYGADSIFPAIESVEIEGRVCGLLKYANINSSSIQDAEDAGRVVSFAQTDVIERLLGGADPVFVEKSADFIRQAIIEVGDAIDLSFRPKKISKARFAEREKMLAEIAALFEAKYRDDAAKQMIGESTAAFDRMIALMPKQELVNLAEALVSITAVERKASSDMGTVGGPIDVALITKHEGFVWIKRKQHFDPNLNPRYFWRRYGKNSAGEGYGAGANWSERPQQREAVDRAPRDGAGTAA